MGFMEVAVKKLNSAVCCLIIMGCPLYVLLHLLLGIRHRWMWEEIPENEIESAKVSTYIVSVNALVAAMMCAKNGYFQGPEMFAVCFTVVAACQLCFIALKSVGWTRRRGTDVAIAAMTMCSYIACAQNAPDNDFTVTLILILPLLANIILAAPRSTEPAEILGTLNLIILSIKLLTASNAVSTMPCLLFATDIVTVSEQRRWLQGDAGLGAQGARTMNVMCIVLTLVCFLLEKMHNQDWRLYLVSLICVVLRLFFLHLDLERRVQSIVEETSHQSEKDAESYHEKLNMTYVQHSDEVEASRPGVFQTMKSTQSELGSLYGSSRLSSMGDLKSLAKKVFDIMKRKASEFANAMGSWRAQQFMALGTCLYSMFSMLTYLNITEFDHGRRRVILSPQNAAAVAAILSFLTVLVCTVSLLKDFGFPVHVVDKNFKMATVLKAVLISLKLLLNFYTPKHTTFLAHFMLVSAAWLSLMMQMMLTFKETSNEAVIPALKAKVNNPERIVKIYKIFWLCTKGGLAVLLIGASFARKTVTLVPWTELQYCFRSASEIPPATFEKSLRVSVSLALALAFSSVLTNELARMMEDPVTKFTATPSGDGARTVVGVVFVLSFSAISFAAWEMVSCCYIGIAAATAALAVAGVCACCVILTLELGDQDEVNSA